MSDRVLMGLLVAERAAGLKPVMVAASARHHVYPEVKAQNEIRPRSGTEQPLENAPGAPPSQQTVCRRLATLMETDSTPVCSARSAFAHDPLRVFHLVHQVDRVDRNQPPAPRIKDLLAALASPSEPVSYVLSKINSVVVLSCIQGLSMYAHRIRNNQRTSQTKDQRPKHLAIIACLQLLQRLDPGV